MAPGYTDHDGERRRQGSGATGFDSRVIHQGLLGFKVLLMIWHPGTDGAGQGEQLPGYMDP